MEMKTSLGVDFVTVEIDDYGLGPFEEFTLFDNSSLSNCEAPFIASPAEV